MLCVCEGVMLDIYVDTVHTLDIKTAAGAAEQGFRPIFSCCKFVAVFCLFKCGTKTFFNWKEESGLCFSLPVFLLSSCP